MNQVYKLVGMDRPLNRVEANLRVIILLHSTSPALEQGV